MSNLMTATADPSSRQAITSASSQRYEVQRTKPKFGESAISFAGQSAWNSLRTSDFQKQSDTKIFKKLLKTSLCAAAHD